MALGSVAEVRAVLARTPGTLRALLDGLPPEWTDEASEGAGTFSPRDVLTHLIHGEKTDWIPRARIILESGEARPFEPFDRFGSRKSPEDVSIPQLLDELARLRAESLAALDALSIAPAQLSLRGTHPEFGPVTLGQLLATWAVHDLNHIGQVVRVMSNRYREAVGPWTVYLGILGWKTPASG